MFVFIGRFVVAAVITFAAIFTMTPVAYMIWFDSLRDMNSGSLQAAGDTFFSNLLVLNFAIPGLIIIWGIVVAVRKRVAEQYEDI